MITLLNYEKAQGGLYVCHFSVGSADMTYAEAEKEFEKISDPDFVVSPATMSIPFTLGVPGYGSTITMYYNTGVTVFYKAGEYTSDVIRGDEILENPDEVNVDWKTIFENNDIISAKTYDGKEYYAMTGCRPPYSGYSVTATENGHYGWPSGKDASEWTDEEWEQGPLWSVDVDVPTQGATIGTVVGTPTQVQTGETETGDPEYETLYCIECDALKTILDSSDELVFKLSDSQYTRPLMGVACSSSLCYIEIADYEQGGYPSSPTGKTIETKVICILQNGSLRVDESGRSFLQKNMPLKVPYNSYSYAT